jgi:hypothetical protein
MDAMIEKKLDTPFFSGNSGNKPKKPPTTPLKPSLHRFPTMRPLYRSGLAPA